MITLMSNKYTTHTVLLFLVIGVILAVNKYLMSEYFSNLYEIGFCSVTTDNRIRFEQTIGANRNCPLTLCTDVHLKVGNQYVKVVNGKDPDSTSYSTHLADRNIHSCPETDQQQWPSNIVCGRIAMNYVHLTLVDTKNDATRFKMYYFIGGHLDQLSWSQNQRHVFQFFQQLLDKHTITSTNSLHKQVALVYTDTFLGSSVTTDWVITWSDKSPYDRLARKAVQHPQQAEKSLNICVSNLNRSYTAFEIKSANNNQWTFLPMVSNVDHSKSALRIYNTNEPSNFTVESATDQT
jgi:hypothetical protein